MAKNYTLNIDELPEERQAEIAEQAKRHEEDAANWQEVFQTVDERVLSPMMTEIADELSGSGKWLNGPPRTQPRLSGSGVKSAGRFEAPVGTEGGSRPVDVSVELYPTTNRRFIAYVDVGGKIERQTFSVEELETSPEETDERLRTWLGRQFDRHIRQKAYH